MYCGTENAPAADGVVLEAQDSQAALTTGVADRRVVPFSIHRSPQALVARCSSFALSVACVTERGICEHGIVPDGAADAPAAPDVVADVWDSHANVLSNQACMSPQR